MPTETKIDCETKNHLSLSEALVINLQLLQGISHSLTFLRYLLSATRNHIAPNLTKFMAT
jgi:hypothetical protein